MTIAEIDSLCTGTPLDTSEGERVYLRGWRGHPNSGNALAVVADDSGGTFAAQVSDLSRLDTAEVA